MIKFSILLSLLALSASQAFGYDSKNSSNSPSKKMSRNSAYFLSPIWVPLAFSIGTSAAVASGEGLSREENIFGKSSRATSGTTGAEASRKSKSTPRSEASRTEKPGSIVASDKSSRKSSDDSSGIPTRDYADELEARKDSTEELISKPQAKEN